MNHVDPNTMRARARQAIDLLKTQLFDKGTVDPVVALYFDDHIEQVQFEDPSILEHFDVRTARSFDYLRTLVGIKTPQAAMIALNVRMGLFENDEREVVAEKTAIFLMLDSPLLAIQPACRNRLRWRAFFRSIPARIMASCAGWSSMPSPAAVAGISKEPASSRLYQMARPSRSK